MGDSRKLPQLSLDELKDVFAAAQPIQRTILPAPKGWYILRCCYFPGEPNEPCVFTLPIIGFEFNGDNVGHPVYFDFMENHAETWYAGNTKVGEYESVLEPGQELSRKYIKDCLLYAKAEYENSQSKEKS